MSEYHQSNTPSFLDGFSFQESKAELFERVSLLTIFNIARNLLTFVLGTTETRSIPSRPEAANRRKKEIIGLSRGARETATRIGKQTLGTAAAQDAGRRTDGSTKESRTGWLLHE